MTIIVFLVDTSASMNQRTYMGTTLLDTAKGAVEVFMKVGIIFAFLESMRKIGNVRPTVSDFVSYYSQIRSRDPNCRWDRYMLLTFDDPPANVKVCAISDDYFRQLLASPDAGVFRLCVWQMTVHIPLSIWHFWPKIGDGSGLCRWSLRPFSFICLTRTDKCLNALWVVKRLIML